MSTTTQIRRVSYSEIVGAHNAQTLIDEYAAECSVPDQIGTDPQHEAYRALERAHLLQCFGAYQGEEADPIGFVFVVTGIMPHSGKRIATIESLFVAAEHRSSGAGLALLDAAEGYARETYSVAILYNTRIGSRLETILSRRSGCERTHTQFTRLLP